MVSRFLPYNGDGPSGAIADGNRFLQPCRFVHRDLVCFREKSSEKWVRGSLTFRRFFLMLKISKIKTNKKKLVRRGLGRLQKSGDFAGLPTAPARETHRCSFCWPQCFPECKNTGSRGLAGLKPEHTVSG